MNEYIYIYIYIYIHKHIHESTTLKEQTETLVTKSYTLETKSQFFHTFWHPQRVDGREFAVLF